jgi:preprotein translocase subunit SecD
VQLDKHPYTGDVNVAARKTRSARRPGSRGWAARAGGGRGPGRFLALLGVIIVALYATMFGTGNLTPRLGIDLAGGTSAIYTASPPKGSTTGITAANMATAVSIIQDRVNGFGVSEAQVSKQGSDTIDVEIPGQNVQQELAQIGQTALLYFRPVLAASQGVATPTTSPSPSGAASPSPSGTPTTGSVKSSASPSATGKASTTPSSAAKTSGAPSAQSEPMSMVKDAATPSASANGATPATPTATGAAAATTPAATAPAATPSPTSSVSPAETAAGNAYLALDCSNKSKLADVGQAAPADYLATCSTDGTTKYLLGPSLVSGSDVSTAEAIPVTANNVVTGAWQVSLTFNKAGTAAFASATTSLYSQYQSSSTYPSGAFAVTLDGIVESAPQVDQGAITGGQAQITGSFTASQAQSLATVLSYGALPLSFKVSTVSIVNATLGGSQLEAGLLAGAIGLLLVFLYVIFYYRGLSAVAISSLVVAGSLTYALAVLLGPVIGFTLSLAGVAGLIVAIGITADSFVVFFERLRDEVREGRTLRTAVEHGWVRARRTIIASDFVSFLAAAVLYELTIGSIKGFAFTLGLTTVIDIVVVFLFTKPLVTILSRTQFFGGGHKWSGLDPERLGGTRASMGTEGPASRMTVADRRRAAAAESEDGGSDAAAKRSVEA